MLGVLWMMYHGSCATIPVCLMRTTVVRQMAKQYSMYGHGDVSSVREEDVALDKVPKRGRKCKMLDATGDFLSCWAMR